MSDQKPRKQMNQWPDWPNARDWIGLGTFALTVMILWMIKEDQSLRQDEFFKTIATLIIGTGFINGVVSWGYSATKGGQELADKNAQIVHNTVAASTANGEPTPKDAVEAATQVADAAEDRKDAIAANSTG